MQSPDKTKAPDDAFRQHAWDTAVSLDQIPSRMKSMILWLEQKLLHWLAREYFSGSGAIGDLGYFIGSSTMSLASGLMASAMEAHKADTVAMGVFNNLVSTMDYWKTGQAYESEMEDKF